MASQLELLKRELARAQAEAGPDNPYVQGLKMQIARLEKPRAENPMAEPEVLSAEIRTASPDES